MPTQAQAVRVPLLRTRELWAAVAASVGWAAVGGWLLRRFFRTGAESTAWLASYVLWPGQLFDFHTPAVPVPAVRTLLFALAVVVYYLLLLLPWWLPSLEGRGARRVLGFALIAAHLVASVPLANRTSPLFELARVVRDL